MRKGFLAASLAIAAASISGCQTTSPNFDSGVSTASGGGTTTGTTGTGTTGTGTTGTGSSTGTSTGQVLSSGSTTFAFNDAGATTNGSTATQVAITGAGTGIGSESASVAVDVSTAGLTWSAPVNMPLFKTTIDSLPGVPDLGGSYREYRQITSETDAELQLWTYAESRVGQYTVYFDPSAPNNNNVAMFFDGNATPESALPATTANYNGTFGGVANVSNFAERDRRVDDPYDIEKLTGDSWSPNGTWRVTGDATIVANFTDGTVGGTIDSTTWRRYDASPTSPDGYITITPSETSSPFHDYTLAGTISGSTYNGTVTGPSSASGGVVTGDNALEGGFFGPTGEETAGVIRSFTTAPAPTDGRSPYEENRRGFIDIRGVFHAE